MKRRFKNKLFLTVFRENANVLWLMLFAGLLPVFVVNAFGSVAVTATMPGVTNAGASGPTLATSTGFDMNGGNTVALLFTGENSSGSDVINTKFAGQSMTLGVSINEGSQWSGIFYLIDPAVTSGQFVMTTSGTSSVCAYSAIALSGVDSVADFDADANTESGTTISLMTTDANDNGFVLGAAVNNGWSTSNSAPSFVSGDADQTLLPSTLVGSSGHLHTYGNVPAAGANTNVYGNTVQRNAYVTLAFDAAPDDTPPAAPTGLAATTGNNTVLLNWDDNAEADLGGYHVKQATDAGGPYTTIAENIAASYYTDNTVINETTYFYVISAVDTDSNESDDSDAVSVAPQVPVRYMENLDRGVIAVYKGGTQVYVGWRLFGTDPTNIAFNIYRNGTKINSSPITNSTNYLDTGGSSSSTYQVAPVMDGVEQGLSNSISASVWDYFKETGFDGAAGYHDIPLQRPANDFANDGSEYSYSPNDCSVADLDGDGQYEIIVKWEPSIAAVSGLGFVGKQILDAYELDGTFLWRIDLGINIRAGSHYTAFMVYDLDSDGKAELVCKTADGTTDGLGTVLGDSNADWRDPDDGSVLDGPEYLSVFDGQSGALIDTVDYIGVRGTLFEWGDDWNRVDRFLGCVAYLDGVHPSVVMTRGIYDKILLEAWDFVDGQLKSRWVFDTDDGYPTYVGQGNHNLSVADVDDDGFDEIIYGSCTIDHDGTGLYSTELGHGDALHVSDMDPSRPGLEVWQCHESSAGGASFRDAATGAIIWEHYDAGDIGRCLGVHMDSDTVGYQLWSWAADGTYNVNGTQVSTDRPSMNFAVWWTADLQRELLDTAGGDPGNAKLDKWNSSTNSDYRFLNIYRIPNDNWETVLNNSTKATPCLSGDILGDWREEMIFRDRDNTKLRILTTTDLTSERIYTLMHDPQYRLAIAWQNVGYNQPPHPSFYIGAGMSTPPMPSIRLAGAKFNPADIVEDGRVDLDDFAVLALQWTGSPGIPSADIAPLGADNFSSGDGIIDDMDLSVLCENWLVIKKE